MWCGPRAVARLINWTPEQVWLHVRWYREQRGRRFKDVPRGGTNVTELSDAIRRAGYEITPVFRSRRVWLADVRALTLRGRFLVRQSGHLACIINGEAFGLNPRPVVDLWRITRSQKESP